MKYGMFVFLLLTASPSRAQYVGGIGGGGDHACGAALQVLPVELLHFSASEENLTVRLQWTTASELNNAGFHVERAAEGVDFDVIGEVEGMGTAQSSTSYYFVDRQPLPGVSYYRLRQTDLDGTATWSAVVAVQIDDIGPVAYPNPVHGVLTIQCGSGEVDQRVEVFDGQGRSVLLHILPGRRLMVDMSPLPAGCYRVRISNALKAKTLAVIKE